MLKLDKFILQHRLMLSFKRFLRLHNEMQQTQQGHAMACLLTRYPSLVWLQATCHGMSLLQ